jgi:tRNA modification GTPase
MLVPSDTIAALATPVGTSALALIRASGPMARLLVPALFARAPLPRIAQHADYRDPQGILIDDVLFTFFAGPNSFTGEDCLEISCHGNPFIAQKILADLLARGCRSADPGEFSKRAFLSGRLDLSQAEAVMDLIHARSDQALAAANQQLRGSLGRYMAELTTRLIKTLAHIEAYIDFPDEDLPEENRQSINNDIYTLISDTARLLATSHYGALLREGIKTVILGEPNAGKSSLLNCLVGHERALVSPEPGTTRDYLEELIIIGPYWLRLIDTAGLNLTPAPLEQRGIDKSLEQATQADLFLWVIDATHPRPDLPSDFSRLLTTQNTLVVYNKCDLPVVAQSPLPQPFQSVNFSTITADGLTELQAALVNLGASFQVNVGSEVIAINARHTQALEQAQNCLQSAKLKLAQNIASELLSSDLRSALESFAQISGKIDHERILDELFASFCIGK